MNKEFLNKVYDLANQSGNSECVFYYEDELYFIRWRMNKWSKPKNITILHVCKHIYKIDEGCMLNNKCKYPNCNG